MELAVALKKIARALFQSAPLLMSLPDYVEGYPGAYSGSICGRGLSGKPVATIGFERHHNRALAVQRRVRIRCVYGKGGPSSTPEH